MMLSKIALLMAVALCAAISTLLVDAQATVLTSPGSGKTSPVQGIAISKMQYMNSSKVGLYAPFAYTTMEIGATTDDMVLIHTNGQSAKAFEWNIIWNFTTAESNTIRTYFKSIPLRNNAEVQFTATWDASGRFAITTSAWKFAFQSLMPYGLGAGCDLAGRAMASRGTLVSLPGACSSVLVPGQKQLAQATPQCLLLHARTSLELDTACKTVRAFLGTVYCTDGESGVDAVCKYNADFLPSGVAGPTVLSVGTDGFPSSGRASTMTTTAAPKKNSAGQVSFAAVMVLVSVIVATLF